MNKPAKKTLNLIYASVLIAIIIVMTFTPLGYIRTAGLEITLIIVPVAVGAIALGEKYGALLGLVFGITSFIQCFGFSPFGSALLSINAVYTFILCVMPRVLTGLLCGLVFKGLKKVDKTKYLSYLFSSLSCALFNTALFMSLLYLMFGKSEYLLSIALSLGVSSFLPFVFAFVGLNGAIEAVICTVFATAISIALSKAKRL